MATSTMSNKIKNIENRGWEGMSALLDSHMPQKKNKRPIFLFWSASAAAASILLFSGLFFLSNDAKEPSGITKVDTTTSNAIEHLREEQNDIVTNNINDNTPALVQNSSDIPQPLTNVGIFKNHEVKVVQSLLSIVPIENNNLPLTNKKVLDNVVLHQGGASLSLSYYEEDIVQKNKQDASVVMKSQEKVELTLPATDLVQDVHNNFVQDEGKNDEPTPLNTSDIESTSTESLLNKPESNEMTLVKSPMNLKNDFYISPALNGIFNVDDKTSTASVGLDLGYKINKVSLEVGGEYISNNTVNLTSSEVGDFLANRVLDIKAIQLPIENLAKSSAYFEINNGKLLALNAKMKYDISRKLSLYGGVQRVQSNRIFKSVKISQEMGSNSGFASSIDIKKNENTLSDYLQSSSGAGIVTIGQEYSGFSYIMGLSYKILKRLNINIGMRSNFKPKNSINEYAVANNLPLITLGASYKMF